jgi:DNA helicase-2/ATP-dependent DNA helicase PcrA
MVKLEENYRSRENILEAANELISNNTQRIDKVLKPTRGAGELIHCYRAEDEIAEAQFVVNQLRTLERQHPELSWGSFAVLYRTNAQSRPFEETLVRWGIPYTIVGGLKFYDRKEIKDVLAYLRAIVNPFDTVSLLRVINTPRRGVGKATIDALVNAAQQLSLPLWEILSDETSVNTLAGRSAKGVNAFAQLILHWQEQVDTVPPSEIVQGVMEDSGYIRELQNQGTDESLERLQNLQELYNAVLQFEEENEDVTLGAFLASTALTSDLDNLEEGQTAVSLLTLHASKGLEFPVVFLVGLEQGLFPNFRCLDDPNALEEERRLCYVGITRAQERLYLSHARERRLYGSREPAASSQFLKELPEELLNSGQSTRRSSNQAVGAQQRLSRSDSQDTSRGVSISQQNWQVGDRILHKSFGIGEITHIFGSGNKISLAIKFANLGQKIIDPKIAQLERV